MRRKIGIFTLVLCLLIFAADCLTGYPDDLMYGYEGETVNICGRVVKEKEKEESRQLFLDDVTVCGREYEHRIKVNIYEETPPLLYTEIEVSGEVCIPAGRRNPGCFDMRKYLRTNDVYVYVNSYSYAVKAEAKGIRKLLRKLRIHTEDFLKEHLSEENFSVATGIIFGDTSYIDENLLEVFRKGGTAHMLAVSGLHMGILYTFTERFRRKKRSMPYDIVVTAVLLIYSALAGFSASVMRAFLMILTRIAAVHLDMRYDFFCSCCFAMDVLLLKNPYQLFNTGFQMSFAACFTIAFLLPAVSEKIRGGMALIVTMQLGMTPYTAYTFNYISLSSFIGNIPVMFLGSLLVPAGISLIPLSYVPVAGDIAAEILEFLTDILVFFNRFTYADGVFTFNVVSMPLALLIIIYILPAVYFSEWGMIQRKRGNRKKILSVILAAAVAAAGMGKYYDDGFSDDAFVFVDVGQGDCLHIRSKKNVLIDGGGAFSYDVGGGTLKPYLLKNGADHIDIAFITHLHTDHYKGIAELSQDYRIDCVAVYAGNRADEERIKEEIKCKKILYLKKGDVINIDRDLVIEVLAPEGDAPADDEDENSSSLVLKATVKGVSVLMTADIDEEGERKILDGDLKSSIIKVAHHGSAYSSCSEFIDRVSPETAVISVGKNNYGHPSPETVKRLEEKGITVYRTDECGAVGIEVHKGGNFTVDKMTD